MTPSRVTDHHPRPPLQGADDLVPDSGDTRRAIHIRPLTTVAEITACVDLQRAVWRWSDLDIMPARVFILMQQLGGLVLGAHEEGALVGFVNCLPGVRDGVVHWHSHMMGVLPSCQNRGIGAALKHAQREHAQRRGVQSIEWVFDPLQAKNGYLNIAKLGAVARRYSIAHYGASSSPHHAGLESDRLVAEWHVGSPSDPPPFGERTRTIAIPADIQAVRRADPSHARALQLAVRDRFVRAFAEGFVLAGCERHADGITYICRETLRSRS